MGKKRLKVGSKIVENGHVFRIFKIESKSNGGGESKRILHYRHFFKSTSHGDMRCSVPEDSIDMANIRMPISNKDIDEILSRLKTGVRLREPVDVNEAKSTMKMNDIFETVEVLRKFWRAKNKDGESFTKTKENVLEYALSTVAEEVAYVRKMSLERAEEKLIIALES
jgi:RNA polymerase-interacting CarD/CdnL/TRCF family regulator